MIRNSGSNLIKKNVLICGEFSYTPLGRHTLAFIETLKDFENIEIYLNVVVSSDSEKLLKKLLHNRSCKIQKISAIKKIHFAIYTHLIPDFNDSNYYHSLKFEKIKAVVNIVYCVFDGTVPPLHWISFVNDNFDLCVTPSKFIANTLTKYGLSICCFSLHCPIINDDYLQHYPELDHNKKFRFGFIGTIDFKKNLPLLISSFSNEFLQHENIELYIHITGTPDIIMKDDIQSSLEIALHKNRNIIVTYGHVSQKKIEETFVSFDAYVFPQKITGYFTTIAEALSIGIPVITSYIPPLIEITDYIESENNVFWLKSNKFAPAFANFSNYMLLGACFECSQTDLQTKMRELYSNRVYLFNKDLIAQRKEAGKKLSADKLKDKWRALIIPDIFQISDEGHGIVDGTLCINSHLHLKYQQIYSKNEVPTTNKQSSDDTQNKKPYWYEDLPEYQVIEEFSRYHQHLVRSLITNKRMHIAPEYSKQRNLLFHLNRTFSLAYEILTSKSEIKKTVKTIILKINNIF